MDYTKEDILSLIADDSYALQFQSISQYRSALIKEICSKEEECHRVFRYKYIEDGRHKTRTIHAKNREEALKTAGLEKEIIQIWEVFYD